MLPTPRDRRIRKWMDEMYKEHLVCTYFVPIYSISVIHLVRKRQGSCAPQHHWWKIVAASSIFRKLSIPDIVYHDLKSYSLICAMEVWLVGWCWGCVPTRWWLAVWDLPRPPCGWCLFIFDNGEEGDAMWLLETQIPRWIRAMSA